MDELDIDSSTGALSFKTAADYETRTSYEATVTASDGTNTTTQSVTVNVTDVNDNSPVFTSDATFSAAENQTSVGTIVATDADVNDLITFTVSGTDASAVNINSSTGVLSFKSAPDYETKATYSIIVTASDGSNDVSQYVTINISDEYEIGLGSNKTLDIGEVINFNYSDFTYFGLYEFGGVAAVFGADPLDTDNTVLSIDTSGKTETWGGVSIGNAEIIFGITDTLKGMTLKVLSPKVGVKIRVQLTDGNYDHRI